MRPWEGRHLDYYRCQKIWREASARQRKALMVPITRGVYIQPCIGGLSYDALLGSEPCDRSILSFWSDGTVTSWTVAAANLARPPFVNPRRVTMWLRRLTGLPIYRSRELGLLTVNPIGAPYQVPYDGARFNGRAALEPEWLTSTVCALTKGILKASAYDRLPILADALEEAGCDCRFLLDGFRNDTVETTGVVVKTEGRAYEDFSYLAHEVVRMTNKEQPCAVLV